MTPTAQELLNDPAFLRKRIQQQREYIEQYEAWYDSLQLTWGRHNQTGVPMGSWRFQRKVDVISSAKVLLNYYDALLQLLAVHGIFPTEKEE